MGENSAIEWTDHTFNPWRGCVEVHAGCDHCYAREMSKRNPAALGTWGAEGVRVVAAENYWRAPLKWNACAEAAGVRDRVFCASLADVFENWRGPMVNAKSQQLNCCVWCKAIEPSRWKKVLRIDQAGEEWPLLCKCGGVGVGPLTMDDVRRRLFTLIDATPWLDWILVTKRPENVRRMWIGHDRTTVLAASDPLPGEPSAGYRENVWILTSVSDQATAHKQIPELVKCRDLSPVSHATIANYEKVGASSPPVNCIAMLADVYEREVAWFLEKSQSLVGVRYRYLSSRVLVRERHQFETEAQHWLEGYFKIEQRLRKRLNGVHSIEASWRELPPADLAFVIRQLWKYRHGDTIRSVVEIMEGFGIRVIELRSAYRIDGLAARFGNEYAVVLNPSSANDRGRMNAAHELGHVLYGDCNGSGKTTKAMDSGPSGL